MEKCSESTGINSVLFFFNSFFKTFQPHIIASLFAIAITSVYFIHFNVGLRPSIPEMELNLDGYSDRQGTAIDNLQLSTERLVSIRDYFVAKGVDENRINLHAYGEKDFLSTPGELESYMYDRRVVVSFKAPAQISKDNVAIINPASR